MCKSPNTLERYKDELHRCASEHLSVRITNKNEDYAVAFYAELFRNTESTAKIFCEGAHSNIWRNIEFQNAFEDLLKKTRINIMVLTEENVENLDSFPNYIQKIIQNKATNVQFRHLTLEAREIISSRFEGDVNFAVFDNDKFRFEFDKTHYTAYGSFNDSEVVKEIQKYFDEAFEKSEVTAFKSPSPSFEVLRDATYVCSESDNNATTIYHMDNTQLNIYK